MEEGIPDPSVKICTREKWGALPPKSVEELPLPATRLFFQHTDSKRCMTEDECFEELRHLQRTYMDEGMPDLPFSFLVGGDLRVYEGRGWGVRIRRTDLWEWNDDRVVIALMTPQRIKVTDKVANKMMWKAYALMYQGVEENKLVDFDKHIMKGQGTESFDEAQVLRNELKKAKNKVEEDEKRRQRVAEHFENEEPESERKQQSQTQEKTEPDLKETEKKKKKKDKDRLFSEFGGIKKVTIDELFKEI